jgi:predicted DNA-binding ribbon-helix-helix protein
MRSERTAKRSVLVAGHRTSISLEPDFWDALKEIADAAGRSINAVVTDIDRDRTTNLSSAIRVHVLKSLQSRLRAPRRAG